MEDTLQINAEPFVPNKALGQNFLIDEAVVARIVTAAALDGQNALEIGPGMGALTGALLTRASRVVAIEKDARLCEGLKARFGEALTLVHADALHADIPSLMGGAPWHAVSNLPYYATTPITLRLLSLQPASLTLMVQREAAARFFAQANERVYGALAILSQHYYEPCVVCDVPRSAFSPQPDVDSRVVRLEGKPTAAPDASAFLAFLQRAFAMRRKTLSNNMGRDPRLLDALRICALPENVRAEALEPEALYRVFSLMNEC